MTGTPDEAVTRLPSAGTGKPANTTVGRASALAKPGTGPAEGVADTDAAAGTTAAGTGSVADPGVDSDGTALAGQAGPPAPAVSDRNAAGTVDGTEAAAGAAGISAGSTGAADGAAGAAGADGTATVGDGAAAEPAGIKAVDAGPAQTAEAQEPDPAGAADDTAEAARTDGTATVRDGAAAEPAGIKAVDAGPAQTAEAQEPDPAGAADGAEGAAGLDTAGSPAAEAADDTAETAGSPASTASAMAHSDAADDTTEGAGAGEAGQALTGDDERPVGAYRLGNRYTLAERIAAGGMGEVWRGVDELLGRPVAVKLLNQRYAADGQFRARFRAEARYAASLSHAGIARVYDYGESDQELPGEAGRPVAASVASPHTLPGPPGEGHPAGVAYLVMELVEGEPLSAILAREGQLPVAGTLDLIEQAATALQAAHAAGIVHRDIKPGNMLITPDGQVKITDFGIARAVLATPLTQTGMVIGTARYVSPEQASGAAVTVASDIYSLGVVGYECLAGEPPFTAEAPLALALAHVSRQPPPLPGSVPQPVAALIGQMLAKDPANRPASAQAVAERARALRDGLVAADTPAVRAGRPGAPAPTVVDLQSVAGLATPAAWLSRSSMTSPAPGLTGTAPMRGKGERRGRWIRSALSALIVVAVLTTLTAGAIAVISGSRNPAATAGPKHPSGRARTHRTGPSRQPSHLLPAAPAPAPTHRRPTSARPTTSEPSRSPTTSPSPSPSPDPSGTPTGTPSPTSTPTPTGTGSGSASSSQSPRQPGTTTTQDG